MINGDNDHYHDWTQQLAGTPGDLALPTSELRLIHQPPQRSVQNRSFLELFEVQVELTPNAIAVIFEQEELTYYELNRRSNQLAHYLRRQGAGPEVRVGICMERNLELVVGLLGILKAGGAYVPLDPAYPPARLSFILTDTQVPLLLTQKRLANLLPKESARVVFLDAIGDLVSQENGDNPPSVTHEHHLAYVIYTSGSTGHPKGVEIRHSSVALLIEWALKTYTPQELRGVLASTSICFDLFVFELFVPLSIGGKCILVDNALHLANQGKKVDGVTLVNTVPSVARELLHLCGFPSTVQTINLAGEALPLKLVQDLYTHTAARRIFNLYGPSEDTTYSTCALLPTTITETPPIGYPIQRSYIYLLDKQFYQVPPRTPGEIYIGGDGLARGYLNCPDLTAERFVPDPFSREIGARLYRTGDLARYLPNGSLEFLGRLDRQVKLRGHRIELGEIEKVLTQQLDVQDAAVLLHEDLSGDRHLVAYIVPSEAAKSEKKEQISSKDAYITLRRSLQEHLPDYMVPAYFMVLERLPLTPNGKLDRRALPVPDIVRSVLETSYVAPELTIHYQLVHIWEELLSVRPIGIHDNFFALGGHSLLAARLMTRLAEVYGTTLLLSTLLKNATIEELASVLQKESREQQTREKLPQLKAFPRNDLLPTSLAQQHSWLLDQSNPENPIHSVPLLLRFSGPLNISLLEKSVQAIIQRHENLRTTFKLIQGQIVQIVQSSLRIPLPVANFETFSAPERESEALSFVKQHIYRRFDISKGPLLRTYLLRLEKHTHLLLVVMHHIISDGWSLNIFFRELMLHYKAFQDGSDPSLPLLPIQFVDYVMWQSKWLQGEFRQKQLDHWTKLLADAPATLQLPANSQHLATESNQSAVYRIYLPASLSDALRKLSQQEGVTLFTVLLTGFAVLLSNITGQRDLMIGTAVARRTRSEIENLIGLFAELLALRINLTNVTNWRELLQQVSEVALEAYRNQDVSALEIARALRHTWRSDPLYRVIFTMYDMLIQPYTSEELTVSSADLDEKVTFDLEMHVEDLKELKISISYRMALFDENIIHQLGKDYQETLEELVESVGEVI